MRSGRSTLLDALSRRTGHATCVTWTPEGVDPVAAARLTGADGVLVSAADPDSADSVARLRSLGAASLWAVSGPLGRLAESVGWSEALRSTVADPLEAGSRLTEFAQDGADEVRRGAAAGADVLWIADDVAGADGWLVEPQFAEKVLVPLYGDLLGMWPIQERPVVFHSDGDIRALFELLAATGFSGVHLAANDRPAPSASASAARALGLVPVGGIAAMSLGPGGGQDAGAQAARLGAEGPMIIADDGGLTSPEELDELSSAIQVARRQLSSRQ